MPSPTVNGWLLETVIVLARIKPLLNENVPLESLINNLSVVNVPPSIVATPELICTEALPVELVTMTRPPLKLSCPLDTSGVPTMRLEEQMKFPEEMENVPEGALVPSSELATRTRRPINVPPVMNRSPEPARPTQRSSFVTDRVPP